MRKPNVNLARKVLEALPGTVAEISEKVRYAVPSVGRCLRAFEAEDKAHIKHQPTNGRGRAPVWEKGPHPEGIKRPQREIIAVPKDVKPEPARVSEEETIERARQQPATWFSGLG